MASVAVRLGRGRRARPGAAPVPPRAPACHAPFTTLFLDQVGAVHGCCYSRGYPLGHIGAQRLPEIWAGARARALRVALGRDDYSLGCEVCDWSQEVGSATYAGEYERFAVESAEPAFPKQIIFAISSTCNLQCVMCDGFISSAIRLHREKLPPLPDHYGEEFFEDLRAFVPHLEEASFMGGEPFLVRGNFRIWDMVLELAPRMPVSVTTNLTRWNADIERVMSSLSVWVNVSLDGHTKATFEAIRPGSNHETVLANLERFRAVADRGIQVLHCLMPQNVHEFVDLLLFAEERDMPVGVNVITRGRPEHCLERLPRSELLEVRDLFARQADDVLHRLPRNGSVLLAQIDRLDRWLAQDHEPLPLGGILDVARRGGPSDDVAARRSVERFAGPGRSGVIAVGPEGLIVDASPSVDALAGVRVEELVGQPADALRRGLIDRYGPVGDMRTIRQTDDVVERLVTFGDTEVLAVTVAIRLAGADANEARIHFSVR